MTDKTKVCSASNGQGQGQGSSWTYDRSHSKPSFFTIKGDVTIVRQNWYHVHMDNLQTWWHFPFPTKMQEVGAYMNDHDEESMHYRDAATAKAIKAEIAVYLSEYSNKTMQVFKASCTDETGAVPYAKGPEIKDDELIGPNAWLVLRTKDDEPKTPDQDFDAGWYNLQEGRAGSWRESCDSSGGGGDKVALFVQENDDWATVALPPKMMDGDNGGGPAGSPGSPINVMVLKKCVASSLKLGPMSKEEVSRMRVYRCKSGQATGAPLKGNILVNPKSIYVVAIKASAPVGIFDETDRDLQQSDDDPYDNNGPQ